MDGNQDPSFHNLNLSQAPAGDFNPQEAIFDTGASHHLTGDNSGAPAFYWAQWNDGDN